MDSKKIGLFLISVVVGIIILFALTGCKTDPPIRKNYKQETCYRADRCRWEAANSEKNLSGCADLDKECRALERFKNCKDDNFRWADQKPQECWDKLNSK